MSDEVQGADPAEEKVEEFSDAKKPGDEDDCCGGGPVCPPGKECGDPLD